MTDAGDGRLAVVAAVLEATEKARMRANAEPSVDAFLYWPTACGERERFDAISFLVRPSSSRFNTVNSRGGRSGNVGLRLPSQFDSCNPGLRSRGCG